MREEIEKEWIADWTAENEGIGKDLGYPDCCVKEFCQLPPQILKTMKPTKLDELKFKMAHINGKWTGFIPCANHAVQIAIGSVTLSELIKDRIIEPDFPNA